MQAATLAAFLQSTAASADQWNSGVVKAAAGLRADDSLLGPLAVMLRGDANMLWARWFAFSLCDPSRYVTTDQGYVHVFADVLKTVSAMPLEATPGEQKTLASLVACVVYDEVERVRRSGRGRIDRETKDLLWDLAGPEPRCWLCGSRFPEWARVKFLRLSGEAEPPEGHMFVDFLTGRGASPQDLQVEVDHVLPAARGGGEELGNLRLTCGWCNRAKRDRTVLYDASTRILTLRHPCLGRVSRPHPFWVVRALAVRGCCQHPGCGVSSREAQLLVHPRLPLGRPTPSNLAISCVEHDPIASRRLVPRKLYDSDGAND